MNQYLAKIVCVFAYQSIKACFLLNRFYKLNFKSHRFFFHLFLFGNLLFPYLMSVVILFWQEYDYVFDVDIEEGKPPLKLPYNITGSCLLLHMPYTLIKSKDFATDSFIPLLNFKVVNVSSNEGSNTGCLPLPLCTFGCVRYFDPFITSCLYHSIAEYVLLSLALLVIV